MKNDLDKMDVLVLHLYTMVLLHLRLIGYIECSYFLVFAPLWIPAVVYGLIQGFKKAKAEFHI